jgi:hypothetical protein
VGADGGKPSRGLVAKPKVQRVISVADATQPPHPTLSRRGKGFSNQDVRGFRDSASQNPQKKVKEAGGKEGAEQPKPLFLSLLFYLGKQLGITHSSFQVSICDERSN